MQGGGGVGMVQGLGLLLKMISGDTYDHPFFTAENIPLVCALCVYCV
jgi:hypothetical protein